jgi:hypothetical protein
VPKCGLHQLSTWSLCLSVDWANYCTASREPEWNLSTHTQNSRHWSNYHSLWNVAEWDCFQICETWNSASKLSAHVCYFIRNICLFCIYTHELFRVCLFSCFLLGVSNIGHYTVNSISETGSVSIIRCKIKRREGSHSAESVTLSWRRKEIKFLICSTGVYEIYQRQWKMYNIMFL